MAVTREQAIAELQRRGIKIPSGVSAANSQNDLQKQAIAELRSRGFSPTGEQLPRDSLLMELGKGSLALGLGAAQGVSDAGQAIAGLGTGAVNELFGTNFKPAEGDVFPGSAASLKRTIPAKIGREVGQSGAAIALGGALGEAAEVAPLAVSAISKAYPTLARALSFALGGAATTPGGEKKRLEGAALTAALPVGGRVLKGATSRLFPKVFSEKALSKLLREKEGIQKAFSKGLYEDAFKTTGDIKPKISQNTIQHYKDLLDEGKLTSAMKNAFKTYERNPTVKGLHFLKSDLRKEGMKLAKRPLLTTEQNNQMFHIEKLSPSLEKDVQNNLIKNNPDAFSKYMKAQRNYAQKVVPFSKYKPVREALGKEESAEGIKRILKRDEKSAAALRELLGLSIKDIERTPRNYIKPLKKLSLYGIAPWVGLHEASKYL